MQQYGSYRAKFYEFGSRGIWDMLYHIYVIKTLILWVETPFPLSRKKLESFRKALQKLSSNPEWRALRKHSTNSLPKPYFINFPNFNICKQILESFWKFLLFDFYDKFSVFCEAVLSVRSKVKWIFWFAEGGLYLYSGVVDA